VLLLPAPSVVGAGRWPAWIWAASSFSMFESSMVDWLFASDGAMTYWPMKLPRPMVWFVPCVPPASTMFVLYSVSQST
jgi:hypothetical protein